VWSVLEFVLRNSELMMHADNGHLAQLLLVK
jgi:hypothetical protein